ncbi:MAG TPA: M23 family metallopeptidase [Candidatus Saccharimonadales bacterium]|nr:M23 family metallopeptidase [Candidatus Saccharimonadales bacterium]
MGKRKKRRRRGLSLASILISAHEAIATYRARRHWQVLAAEHERWIAEGAAHRRLTDPPPQKPMLQPAAPPVTRVTPVPSTVPLPRSTMPQDTLGRRRAVSAAAGLVLVLFAISLAVVFPPAPPFVPAPQPEPVVWSSPRPGDFLTPGSALSHVLDSRGLDSDQIQEITGLLKEYKSPRSLRPGTALRFAIASTGIPERIGLALNPDSILHFVRSDSTWATHIELTPFVMDTVRISGVIESSLWSARLGGDLDRFGKRDFEDLVYDLADILAWKVDFTRDLHRGDSFRLALERKVRPDGTIRSRHFLAIELRNGDRVLRAIPQPGPNGRYVYFDEEGHSLRGAFLRYPVPYRITSHFTGRRFHPILRRWRAHEGIDYGAPAGAPVEATASGVVTRAGFMGGYGRLVEIRHPGEIRTRYAHLSSIAPDVRPGAHVDQGQIVGRVGSSGLATGPHLHYEFLQNGRHRDPLTVQVPNAPAIAASHLTDFYHTRDVALAVLNGAPIPYDTPTSLAARTSR